MGGRARLSLARKSPVVDVRIGFVLEDPDKCSLKEQLGPNGCEIFCRRRVTKVEMYN